MTQSRVDLIRERLSAELAPISLEIRDDSAQHAGHASAGGGGHFTVHIVSDAFNGKSLIQRHRLVYAALSEAMASNEIHALSIKADTPEEFHS